MTSRSLEWVGPYIKKTVEFTMDYYNVAPDKAAMFSTKFGTIPKRQLRQPLAPRVLPSDFDAAIRRKAVSLREEFPGYVRDISQIPTSWYDLHQYFDGVDLWAEGPTFLFYVINHIVNENKALDHELEESKQKEIRNWAKLWVEGNWKRVLSIPPEQGLITIFDKCEMQCIQGLDTCQLDFLKHSLDVCRSEYDYLHAPLDDLSMQAPLHSTKQIHQVRFRQDQSFQPSPHLQVPNIQPTMPHNMHMIPGGPPPIPGRPYSIPMGDPRANPMMFVQPIPPMQQIIPQPVPTHIPYGRFMENRGQVSLSTNQVDFRQDATPLWERRQRGLSNDANRNGKGRGFNNFGHRSNYRTYDRRIGGDHNTARGSPLRRVQVRQDPIYVHDPQRQSPPLNSDATPRMAERGLLQNNQRIVSDTSYNRTGFSNDARLWQPPNRQRTNSKVQEVADVSGPAPPFEGHPRAFIIRRGIKSSCTFWYEGEARAVDHSYQNTRTVFVRNFERMEFETHALKDLFAQFGRVESISFLYMSFPMAFVAYMDESSVAAAINGLEGWLMPSGEKLNVRLPNDRSRSNSQSSQYTAYEPFYRSNSTNNREFNNREFNSRDKNSRGSIRILSTAHRTRSTSVGTCEHSQASINASEGASPIRIPLTEGFNAQLQPAQMLQLHHVSERLNSSIAEVVQHHAAMNRFSNQTQNVLGSVENRTHTRKFSNHEVDHPGKVIQGSRCCNENSPLKDSTKNTTFTSPKKGLYRNQSGDSIQNPSGGRSKKKGNKQSWYLTVQFRVSNMSDEKFTGQPVQAVLKAPALQTSKISRLLPWKKARSVSENKSPSNTPKFDLSDIATLKVPKASAPEPVSPKAITPQAVFAEIHSRVNLDAAEEKCEENASAISSPILEQTASSTFAGKTLRSEEMKSLTTKISDTRNKIDIAAEDAKKSERQGLPNPTRVGSQASENAIVETMLSVEKHAVVTNLSEADEHKLIAERSLLVENNSSTVAASKFPTEDFRAEREQKLKPKTRNKKKKSKERKSSAKSDTGKSTTSLKSKDSSETLKSSFMTESEHFVTARSSPNPSLTSGHSDACLCTANKPKFNPKSQVQFSSQLEKSATEAINHSTTEANAYAGSTPTSALKSGSRPCPSHSKTDSTSTNVSPGSMRKADNQLKKVGEKAAQTGKPAEKCWLGLQNENFPSTAGVEQYDSLRWPTLGPAKGPRLFDGKLPAVADLQPLHERKKNSNVPIIPAVPLSLQRRRPS